MVTYPPDPLPLLREGGNIVSEGANAPSGFPVTPYSPLSKISSPSHDRNIYPYHGESKGGEASLI